MFTEFLLQARHWAKSRGYNNMKTWYSPVFTQSEYKDVVRSKGKQVCCHEECNNDDIRSKGHLGLQCVFFSFFLFFFVRFYLFISRQRGREGERERSINVWLPLTGSLLGTWPTTLACTKIGNLNQQPFGSQDSAQSIGPHQRGLQCVFLNHLSILFSSSHSFLNIFY